MTSKANESTRVLIVDEHPIVRQGLAAVLGQQEGLTIVGEAVDGVDAVAQARDLLPDITLMDLHMPQMDGVETIRRIIGARTGSRIIILTTFATDEYIFSSIEAGAQGYLLKDSPPRRSGNGNRDGAPRGIHDSTPDGQQAVGPARTTESCASPRNPAFRPGD